MNKTLTIVCCLLVSLVSLGVVSQEAAADPATGWEEAVMLEFLNAGFLDPGYPHIAADAFGNAFAVWDQPDGSRNCVFASRYVNGVGWIGPELIDSAGTDSCSNPRVAVDAFGNAVAVWQQMTAWTNSVWANRYVVGEGWGYAQLIESQTDEAGLPQVVVDRSGNATAVWQQYLSGHGHIWSNRYIVGVGWGVEEEVEDFVEDAYSHDIAVDDAGCVVAMWLQYDGYNFNTSANRYVPGEGWGTSEVLLTGASGSAAEPKVAVDAAGNAIAVWCQFDDGIYSSWRSQYVIGGGWSSAALLETEEVDDAMFPRVACDPAGSAIVVWQQRDEGVESIWSSQYAPGDGWSAPETVENNSLFATIPQVVMDKYGVGTAVWYQSDGSRNTICSSTYVAGEGWGEMELVSTNETGGSMSVFAAVDGIGNVFATWLQYDGYRSNVWANIRFTPDTDPPVVSIESPSDGVTLEVSTVEVSGTTEPGATLDVGGLQVSVALDGSFSCVVALLEGENVITATATDVSGNSGTDSVTVTYVNPVYALEEELADALALVVSLQEQLNSSLAELADLQAQLDNATDDVADLEAQLEAAEAALASAQDALDDAYADLAEIEADLLDSMADVLSLQLQLGGALANLTTAQADLVAAEDDLADVQEQLTAAESDLDDQRSSGLVLMAGMVALAGLAAVMTALYFIQWKKLRKQ